MNLPNETRPCRVSLDIFDGPLDLLLHLVKEQRLDIATVPLATVAQQYFEYVALMEAIDVELAAEYLVIAATLVYLKSKSLLPPVPSEFLSEDEDTPEDVEERLRARLIAYSKYKGASEDLRTRQLESGSYYYRDAGDPGTEVVQRYRIDPDRLSAALMAALRQAKPDRRTIVRERVSLAVQMEYVLREVRKHGTLAFLALCAEFERDRIIATFLAILELIRQRRLGFEQEAPCGELLLRPFVPLETHAN